MKFGALLAVPGGAEMAKQRLRGELRVLVNIGLTLQFYIPFVVYLILGVGHIAPYINHPDPPRGSGLAVAIGVMCLFIFAIYFALFLTYFLWDRYGSPRNALIFLLTVDVLLGGAWFAAWVSTVNLEDADMWLFSPLPFALPMIMYAVALAGLWSRDRKTRHLEMPENMVVESDQR